MSRRPAYAAVGPALPSRQFYDHLAANYHEYKRSRRLYLDAIDRVILGHYGSRSAEAVLDVGAGDGTRGESLARCLGARRMLLIDESEGMLRTSATATGRKVVADAAHLPLSPSATFDVILCLNNVLGHLPGIDARRRALTDLAAHLGSGGGLYLDVQNRCNIRNYGLRVVLTTFLRGLISTRGDVRVEHVTPSGTARTIGHAFADQEMKRLFRKSGLAVARRWSVDYDTGRVHGSTWSGLVADGSRR